MPRLWNQRARLDRSIQRHLGHGLRATYHNVVGEPVPLDQIELVLALRRVERDHRLQATVTAPDEPRVQR